MTKYKIVLLNSFGENKVIFCNNWLIAKTKMLWLNIRGKSAVWLEKVVNDE